MGFVDERLPHQGDIVRVRMRRYLVEDVRAGEPEIEASWVRMACLDDDAQGEPLEVLWEKEVDPEILKGEVWKDLAERGFDPARLFSAYLHTLRWNCVTSTDPKLFQSPFRAGIQIFSYQLEPLRKALLLPRVNLFIADDVGLGKTIEAGLIARELLLRKKVNDIVVACPPSMLYQWRDELDQRFGLSFEILDKSYVMRVRQERGYSINPWSTHTRFLVSHRLLIDEAYAGPMRDWLGSMKPGSLLILDEAHHAAPSSGAKYAIDSKITRAVRDIAPKFEHRLFLSATPHNGHPNSFSALLEILDPQRFCRGVNVDPKLRNEVMVRRLKEDLRQISGGFPKRTVVQVEIDGLSEDAPELMLSSLLDQYRQRIESRLAGQSKRQQASAGLLICGLQQRLLSSIEAFARTLRVHKKTMEKRWEAPASPSREHCASPLTEPSQEMLLITPVGMDDDRAELSEEELLGDEEELFQTVTDGMATASLDCSEEKELLEKMTEISEAYRALPDARVARLVEWIRQNMCPGVRPCEAYGVFSSDVKCGCSATALDVGSLLPRTTSSAAAEQPRGPLGLKAVAEQPHSKAQTETCALQKKSPSNLWNDTRIIIFTEYDDTKRYLVQQLEAAITGTDQAESRIEVFHGPTPLDEREEIKRAFNADPKKHPLRILVATDAAREGLNLQTHCWNLFHFDLPWNPSRLEQRNGRIDRKLQPRDEVFCHYFVYVQRPEDRILRALVKKTDTIYKELGSLSQVIDDKLARLLVAGIRRDKVEEMEDGIQNMDVDAKSRQTVEEELEGAREKRHQEIEKQNQQLQDLYESAIRWVRWDEDHFREALSCSLEMMRSTPLTPGTGSGQWAFPSLDRREGADPTWAETLDSLRVPRKKDQAFWEWRREAQIRPIVFEDPGTLNDEVVHLHLGHRIVQRLFGRFMAQGFVYDDLSRACVTHSKDAIPRVVLMGRLSLYGPGAARLHEELVEVTSRWMDPSTRKDPLKPYGRETQKETLDLLEKALLAGEQSRPPDPVLKKLQKSGARDVQELLSSLEKRGAELREEAMKKLKDRADKEAQDMAQILKAQIGRIERQMKNPQLALDFKEFNDDEQRQVEANRRHWARRLEELERELESEPKRIKQLYEVKAHRLEPIGLVYLWPTSG